MKSPEMSMGAPKAPEKTLYEDKLIKHLKELSPDGNYSDEIVKKALEQTEKEGVTFHVAETGLETSVDEVISDEEFASRDNKDFAPNRTWYSVTVANEGDKKKWIDLRNEYLGCAWTPNQDTEERSENAKRMKEVEIEMRGLEQK